MSAIKTAIINAIGDAYESMPIREVMRGADAILEALDKAGYAVVPKKPTEKMFFQSWKSVKDDHSGFINVGVLRTLYAAMLTAAKLSETKQKETP